MSHSNDASDSPAAEDLRISEIRYRRLFETARDGILILDAETRKITDVNPFMIELLGYTREEFVGKELWEIGLLKDEEASAAAFRELQANHYIRYEDLPLENKNGGKWEVEVVSNVYTENNRQVIQCNIRDITERVKSEGKLKQLNLKIEQQSAVFNTLLSSITDMTFTFDRELRFSYANQAVQDLYGKKSEELLGKNFFDLDIAEDLSAPLRQNLQQVFDNGKSIKGETEFSDAAGEIGSYEYVFNPVISADGTVESVVGSAREITERKAAENEMRLMKSAVDSIIEGITISDAQKPDIPIIYTNAAFENLTGYALDEIQGQNCRFLQGTETNPRTVDEIREALEKVTTFRGEILNYHKNGDSFWNELKISPVFDQSGRLTNFVGVQQDISERKRIEIEKAQLTAQIERQHERLNNIVANVPGVVWEAWGEPDAATQRIDFVSDYVETLLGYTVEEWITTPNFWLSIVHPEDKEWMARDAAEKFHAGEDYTRRFRWVAKDGRIVWVESQATVICDETGQPIGLRGINIDITERKQTETAMRFQKTLLEAQSEASIDGVLVVAPDGEVISYNQRFAEMWEVSESALAEKSDEKLRHSVIDKLVNPKEFLETVEYLYENPFVKDQVEITLKGGRVFERYSAPVMNSDKTHFGRIWSFRDITERKEAEEAIRFQAYLLNTVEQAVVATNLDRVVIYWNQFAEKLYGWSAAEAVGRNARDLTMPETSSEQVAEITARLNEGKSWAGEFLVRNKNGDTFPAQVSTSPVNDANGKLICIISVSSDITERKRVEEGVKQSERDYRTVFEQAHDAILIFAPEGEIVLDVNQRACEIYGFSRSEFIGMSIERISKISANGKAKFKETLEAGEYLNFETVQLRKDGSEMSLEVNASTITYQGRQAVITINRDITERKRQAASLALSNDLLKQSEESYRIVAETASDVIITIDEFSTILFVNPAAEKVLGYKPEELTGSNLSVLVPGRLQAAHIAGMSRYLQTGERGIPWSGVEFQAVRRDGREIQIEISFGEYRESNKRLFTAIIRDISERKHAEEALRKAETRYRSLVELSPAVVYLTQPYPPYSPIYVSPNVKVFGYEAEEWLSRDDMWLSIIHKEDRARVLRLTENAMSQGLDTELEYRILGRNKEIYWVHDKGSFISDESGEKIGWQGIILDITKTQALEEQLRQSQKLESVGLLAGGIAHDFNNMLTAINGYSELTLRRLKEDDPLRLNIEEIKKAGQRSADLTHQLLAFSRQQVLHPVVINLNEVISDTIKMLQRLIGEDIQITTVLNPKVGLVKVDPGQFSQIVLNLAVNARDAMPQGGKLTIETDNIFLSPDYAEQRVAVLPGAYVMLAVSDTGTGINAEIKEHIFEPFFTTKEIGQGTGLGLATVYGIVKQSGGIIEVESEQGFGTTFKVYLPRVADESSGMDVKAIPVEMPKGTETILLVEDEDLVRRLSRQILEKSGYTVIEARDGSHALEICEQEDCKFDLLMTDVVMPQMGGRELAEKLRSRLPDIKILFTSGYTDDAIVRHGVIEADTNFIQKPFSPDNLAEKIREILDNI